MRVLVIGSGAREHALCWAVSKSDKLTDLYCAPGNGGTSSIATNVPLDPMNFTACADWAEQFQVDLTIVGPDDPLAGGIVDVFLARGLRIFGPTAAAARIESSKSWAKQLMQAARVRTAHAEYFSHADTALAYVHSLTATGNGFPCVIKADGLAAGKGVYIVHDESEARAAVHELMVAHRLGAAANTILIEDFLTGTELSVFALCDGHRVRVLAPACDYKRAYDNDRGPNTGGMGAYSPPGFATAALMEKIEHEVLLPVIHAMAQASSPFRGLLYAGLMVAREDVHVLEFNARFGDPETQVILPRLASDFLDLVAATADGNLDAVPDPAWSPQPTCGVVIASEGYPGSFARGFPVAGLESMDDDVLVFHAGSSRSDSGELVTSGGRVFSVVASGATMADARSKVYRNVERVRFSGARFRRDIALREL